MRFGEGELQYALSKWLIASLVSSLGLEPVRRAGTGSLYLSYTNWGEQMMPCD